MLQAEVNSKTAFEPVRMQDGPTQWHVRATLPSGKQMQLGDFATEAEAKEWIALKSTEWGELRECQLRMFGAA
jgi:hypothetical protein